jgi:site-specific recombinase XerD
MGMLRDRMEGDLKLSGLSESTQDCYLRCAQRFAEHHGRSPAKMGEQEIKEFLLHLIKEKGASPATHRMYVASLRFLYVVTLKRPESVAGIPYPKVPRHLPQILTGSEAIRLIHCITSITSRTIAAVMYGSGLRLNEARVLTPEDIDSVRGVIHVREGKGRKDREAMLGPQVLKMLREYWRIVHPRGPWLFPSKANPAQPVSMNTIRRALRQAGKAAQLKKRVTPHLLRHCFATHLLETGNDIGTIQVLLGHNSIDTTRMYAQLRTEALRRIKSPLDLVGTAEGEVLR